uniref:Uncharacterized protein n=1 Tax=Anguilla anguilla TaxID=7936 RepID=A0A0E9Q5J0_ANGAN
MGCFQFSTHKALRRLCKNVYVSADCCVDSCLNV